MRRVPVIAQLSATDCGAACLAMVLRYHGRPTRLEECRERCGAGRDGSTALAIAQAARAFGLRVRSYSVELADFAHVALPAIVFWNFNHYLVVERWSDARVDVVDPAQGRRRLSRAEFDAGFTGVTLTFEPGSEFSPQAPEHPFSWRAYLAALSRTPGLRSALAQVLMASILLQALGLAVPLITKVVVDRILPEGLNGLLPLLAAGLLAWVGAQAATGYLRQALLIAVQARLDAQVMLGFFEHLLALPFRFFHQRTSGDLLMRLGSNMLLREMVTSHTLSVLLDGVLVVTYLALLLAWQPVFGAAVVAVGALQVLLLLATSRVVRGLMSQDLVAQAESQTYLVEALTGIATLKAAGAEDHALDHWTGLFFRHLNVAVRRGQVAALIDTGLSILRTAAPLLLLVLGAHLVLSGTLSLGSMLALVALAGSFLSPLSSLVAVGQNLQLAGAHLDRIADVLAARAEQEGETPAEPGEIRGRLELREVSFRYEPAAPLVLEGVSLVIEPGQKVALVGCTGSGKSTLARLLLGLYEPTSGVVLCDDRPLRTLRYRQLRRRFGVVLQEPFLFSGSIRQNIALNAADLTPQAIERAARLAAIHADIERMPMGYESVITEGGTGLSGGQRQRLAIARAVAHEPAVLILDEATSHLDALTEAEVDEHLSGLRCTRVVIAHRLSTVRNADRIVVLDAGRVVAQGRHDELMAQDGLYARLAREQTEPAS